MPVQIPANVGKRYQARGIVSGQADAFIAVYSAAPTTAAAWPTPVGRGRRRDLPGEGVACPQSPSLRLAASGLILRIS